VPALADQVLPIPYLEGGLAWAMEHQRRPGSAGAMERQRRPGLVGASVVVVALDAAGGDGVAIMVTLDGKFSTLLRR